MEGRKLGWGRETITIGGWFRKGLALRKPTVRWGSEKAKGAADGGQVLDRGVRMRWGRDHVVLGGT